jgi:hypothetical protein
MKSVILAILMTTPFFASAAQKSIGDAELAPKAAVYLKSVFKNIQDFKIYKCNGTENSKGMFGTCFFNFPSEGSAADNTHIYLLRQDGGEKFFWAGETDLNEKY